MGGCRKWAIPAIFAPGAEGHLLARVRHYRLDEKGGLAMTRQTAIVSCDIDIAAIYYVSTGKVPDMYREPGNVLVTFHFPPDEATRKVMIEYAAGTLQMNVKQFAACRAKLYRLVRGVK